jgi:hypothetical protein
MMTRKLRFVFAVAVLTLVAGSASAGPKTWLPAIADGTSNTIMVAEHSYTQSLP